MRSRRRRRFCILDLTAGATERDLLDRVVSGEGRLGVRAIVNVYRDLVARLEKLASLRPQDVIEDLFPGGNVDAQLIRELAEAALEETDELRSLFDEMLRSITQPEVPQSPDFVRVMSLHKSKGLTSPVVMIATAIDRVIPTIRDSLSDEEKVRAFEEGRRLFYVALSRCSNELVISSPFRMVVRDAMMMGVSPENVWHDAGEKVTRVMATPYLTELGPAQPDAIRGDDWLASRTQAG